MKALVTAAAVADALCLAASRAASLARTAASVAALGLVVAACGPEVIDVGSYQIRTVSDGLVGFRCQPRTEFYYVDRATSTAEPQYLGTCGTPRFVTEHMHLPGDPACFAVAGDGSSMVYLHRPSLCGAGRAAQGKAGGVYLHRADRGGQMLYAASRQVGQIWSARPLAPDAIRVSWSSREPSAGGAECGQELVIYADGREEPEGEPAGPGTPDRHCGQHNDPADESPR